MPPQLKILERLNAQLSSLNTPVFFTGAGPSYDVSPPEGSLSSNYTNIIKRLSLSRDREEDLLSAIKELIQSDSYDEDEAPYLIAETIVIFLNNRIGTCPFDGINDDTCRAKAELAKAMGLFDDSAWLCGKDFPFRNSYPRYRVIAKFLVEEACSSYWTSNWDYCVEQALEAIGVSNYSEVIHDPPWPHSYMHYLRIEDAPHLSGHIVVHKIHGCTRDLRKGLELYNNDNSSERLEKAISRFIVQISEIKTMENRECGANQNISETDTAFREEFKTEIRQHPLLVIGSKLYDPCIRKEITSDASRPHEFLTIINPRWHGRYYQEIANCYGSDRDFCHLESSRHGDWAMDDIFLWLQTCYTFVRIERYLRKDDENPILHGLADELHDISLRVRGEDYPRIDRSLFHFIDSFLPAWTKVVWKANLIPHHGFYPDDLNLDAIDYYIPIRPLEGHSRDDLLVAVYLLKELIDCIDYLDFSEFPGGFWQKDIGRLYFPIPYREKKIDLQGVKAIRPRIRGRNYGLLEKLTFIPIDLNDPYASINADILKILRRQAIRILGLDEYAYETGGNVDSIMLSTLKENILNGVENGQNR